MYKVCGKILLPKLGVKVMILLYRVLLTLREKADLTSKHQTINLLVPPSPAYTLCILGYSQLGGLPHSFFD